MASKPPNQGGVAPAHVAPSRTSGTPKTVGGTSTPGLSNDAQKVNTHVKPIGGTAKPAR